MPDTYQHLWAFKSFGITEKDIALGLRYIKSKVRSEFKRLAKKHHPDLNGRSSKASTFKELNRLRKRILNLQIMPLSMDNLEAVMEIGKGYVSSHDVILPWD